MNFETYGGRRFLMTLGCGAVTAVLTWFGKVSGEVYATVTIATVGAYIGSNLTQRLKTQPPRPDHHPEQG